MKTTVGIDVGGSRTKIVAFRGDEMLQPMSVKANDPVASAYGAFGKFTSENDLTISDIDKVITTGVGASYLGSDFFGIRSDFVTEFGCVARGGLYLAGKPEAIVVSMGTGTAINYAKCKTVGGKPDIFGTEAEYLGGTGVGGGTLTGLSKKLLGIESIDTLISLAGEGDLSNVDLTVGDITKLGSMPEIASDLTAANFGKMSDLASPSDIALGLVNLVVESAAMLAVFAARARGLSDIVITGHVATHELTKNMFLKLAPLFNVDFIIPGNAQYATAIGAAMIKI
ncbi:MAG: pantothenate kinase [Clostridia bacterium]|nr:pantothenate kinase [Clostridia bacterium]